MVFGRRMVVASVIICASVRLCMTPWNCGLPIQTETLGSLTPIIWGAIGVKFGRHDSWAKGSRCTKFGNDSLKFSYTFPLNPKYRGPNSPILGRLGCPSNTTFLCSTPTYVSKLRSILRAVWPGHMVVTHRRTDGRTDGQTSRR